MLVYECSHGYAMVWFDYFRIPIQNNYNFVDVSYFVLFLFLLLLLFLFYICIEFLVCGIVVVFYFNFD